MGPAHVETDHTRASSSIIDVGWEMQPKSRGGGSFVLPILYVERGVESSIERDVEVGTPRESTRNLC